jgi:hypothetical protein
MTKTILQIKGILATKARRQEVTRRNSFVFLTALVANNMLSLPLLNNVDINRSHYRQDKTC